MFSSFALVHLLLHFSFLFLIMFFMLLFWAVNPPSSFPPLPHLSVVFLCYAQLLAEEEKLRLEEEAICAAQREAARLARERKLQEVRWHRGIAQSPPVCCPLQISTTYSSLILFMILSHLVLHIDSKGLAVVPWTWWSLVASCTNNQQKKQKIFKNKGRHQSHNSPSVHKIGVAKIL